MYAKLKQDMRSANVPVSDGDDLVNSDMQLVRDFLYFKGINIGEEFHRYEEVVHGTVAAAPAATAESDSDDTDGDDVDTSDIIDEGDGNSGTGTIALVNGDTGASTFSGELEGNGATQEPVAEQAAPEQAPAVEDAAPEQAQDPVADQAADQEQA